MNKIYLAKNTYVDYCGCYYEGDTPSLHEDYKAFKTRKSAEEYIALSKRPGDDWQIEELELNK